MGYPQDILSTRTMIKPGLMALIPPEGLVNNVIPIINKSKVSIVASPKMGAGFVQYIITTKQGGGTTEIFGSEEGIEVFVYCIEGSGSLTIDGETQKFLPGSYGYAPAGIGIQYKNESDKPMKLLVYKQKYTPLSKGKEPVVIFGNVNEIEWRIYDDMENVKIKDLLPIGLEYDMNMHILSFEPGGSHPYVETHVQEHGAYVLQGEGLYLLDNQWLPIKKEDFIWFGPYVAQGAYGVGREAFTYIYSKDCNRDVCL